MSKVFDEKAKRFVDRLPMTAAAEGARFGKTKDCGSEQKPGVRSIYTIYDLVPSANRIATTDAKPKRVRWTDRDGVIAIQKK